MTPPKRSDEFIDALIARMHQDGPIDDSPGGYERDDWLGQDAADRMADRAADLDYERRTA